MKVLMLDIDGVLNSHEYFLKNEEAQMWSFGSILQIPKAHIDPEKLTILNKIIDQTGAKIVLSSSWRKMFDLIDIETTMRERGFKGTLFDKTIDHRSYAPRGQEIRLWLENHTGVDKFAILDDDRDMYPLEKYAVFTDPLKGLTDADADLIIKMLNE